VAAIKHEIFIRPIHPSANHEDAQSPGAIKLLLDDRILIARHEFNCLVTDPLGNNPDDPHQCSADADSVGD